MPTRTHHAHRFILDARGGEAFICALEAGAVGNAVIHDGVLHITVSALDGAALGALLSYLYTEAFDEDSLAECGGELSLLRLIARVQTREASLAVERLRQICEKKLADTATRDDYVQYAHEVCVPGPPYRLLHLVPN